MSHLALAISYFFHLVATIVWIGGLALLALVVWPAARQTLDGDPRQADLLAALRRRFTPLANLSLVVLVVTGMIQTSGDPNYGGVLVFDNDWSRAILLKHVAIVGMVITGVILQMGIVPALERLAIMRAGSRADPAEEARLLRRERRLNAVNLALGLLVLSFTAVATAL
jgi:uncharacterized membrane protein